MHAHIGRMSNAPALTEAAAARVSAIAEKQGKPAILRLAVDGGGCSGFQYRFELADGLHIYGEPVPDGMVATTIRVTGPPGLAVMEPILPPSRTLHVAGVDLEVWSGTVDLVVPFYAQGELASETRPLDRSEAPVDVEIRYQACTDQECLLPRTETLTLSLPLDVIDVPALSLHMGHGQREGSYSSMPAMRRLLWRKVRAYPPGFFKYLFKTMKLNLQARKRARHEGGQ